MYNPLSILFHRQTADAVAVETADEFIREDFFIADYEEKTIVALLAELRERTYNFVYENRMPCGTTEFFYGDLPIYVELTEEWNILYTVNRHVTAVAADAAAIIQDVIQF